MKLVLADPSNPAFAVSYEKSHRLYQKYQLAIHNDSRDDCDLAQVILFSTYCDRPASIKVLNDKLSIFDFSSNVSWWILP